MTKVVTAAQACDAIADGATLAVTGFRWAGAPEVLLRSLGARFRAKGVPRDLTLIFSSAQGDNAGTGLENLAKPGLLKRVIGGFWGLSPGLCALAEANEIQAYNFPQGQICRLYGAIAAGLPGLVSSVGLNCYIDPRQGGGRLNAVTPDDLVELVELRGQEWLLYHSLPVDVGFIRGTTADADGNISIEREAVTTEALALAFATHNSGGKVIAQVERMVPRGAIHPRSVAVPAHVVDAVVVAEQPDIDHRQCVQAVYDPLFTGDAQDVPMAADAPTPLLRQIVASRAALELRCGDVANLGQGIPTDIAAVLRAQGRELPITFTIESGVVGGRPEPPPDFGIAAKPSAILRQDDQFTFYDGGGLDVAFLGFAQVDNHGNVNASRFGGRLVGCGGFLDIGQTAKRLVFCGSFTADGLVIEREGEGLRVVREGRVKKFVSTLTEMTLNTACLAAQGRPVTFITERCVFGLTRKGLRLEEVAPGIDVRRDILAQLEFVPDIVGELRTMLLPMTVA